MLPSQKKQNWSKTSSILTWLGQEQLIVPFYPKGTNYLHPKLSKHQQGTLVLHKHPENTKNNRSGRDWIFLKRSFFAFWAVLSHSPSSTNGWSTGSSVRKEIFWGVPVITFHSCDVLHHCLCLYFILTCTLCSVTKAPKISSIEALPSSFLWNQHSSILCIRDTDLQKMVIHKENLLYWPQTCKKDLCYSLMHNRLGWN